MKIFEIINYLNESDYTTVVVTEQNGNWTISQTSAYKKGLKKYKNNPKIMQALEKLLDFIQQHDGVPSLDSYPPEMNIHFLRFHPVFDRPLWGHLLGSKVGIVFTIEPGEIKLQCLGTHPDCRVG
jgi:hypothetical protein